MFPSVIHESVLWWGLPLIGIPILIHLINMMRHRRVPWAAMEFLLQSQKRHRTWIILKQLLLLLARMAAVTAVVLMLAQPVLHGQFSSLLGGIKTHHIILLDDSYSMSDRWSDTSAFRQGVQVVQRLAAQFDHQDIPQTFTLLRFSRASGSSATQPDILSQPIDRNLAALLQRQLSSLAPSQSAAGPTGALEAVEHLPEQGRDENRIVYVVSDFRQKEWSEPAAVRKLLSRMQATGAELHLVSCADSDHGNLGITVLRATTGTRAAGVPLVFEVGVTNYASTAARKVAVLLEEDGQSRPAVTIDEIPPRKTVLRRFPVLFSSAGEHAVTASIESDAIEADNRRFAVVDFTAGVPVLVIDGDAKANDAFFLSTALAPGGSVNSGIKPVIQNQRILRTAPLDNYAAIFLLNVEHLDPAEVAALETYVGSGGGLGFFVGELTQAGFVNDRLYRAGKGLFPLPLERPVDLLVDRTEKIPDLVVSEHPIFSVFAGERNGFLENVNIQRYFSVPKTWSPDPSSGTKVIAKLRTGAPLVVEHRFGRGRVVAVLTKASPVRTPEGSWNNWAAGNPSYVVAMLEMQAYLAAGRYIDNSRLVGSQLTVRFAAAQGAPQVRFVLPEKRAGTLLVDAKLTKSGLEATLPEASAAGVYQAQITTTDGQLDTRQFAVNVAPEEGNLALFDSQQLAAKLPGIRYRYHRAQDLDYDPQQLAGINISQTLLYVLVALLLGEQLLAYALSYHPPKGARAR